MEGMARVDEWLCAHQLVTLARLGGVLDHQECPYCIVEKDCSGCYEHSEADEAVEL